jgi:Ca2+-binding RTX toxin-like protein
MKGDDTITGGSGGADWLLGGQGNDLISVGGGTAFINGNLGADTVNGGSGADTVHGGQGADAVNGGGGNDEVSGDLGNDELSGGTGADTFHFVLNGGVDRVLDFKLGEGDRIELDGIVSYTVVQVGADTVILDGMVTDQLTLAGVQATTLGAGSILLA